MRHGRMWTPAPPLDSPDRSAGTGQVAPRGRGWPPTHRNRRWDRWAGGLCRGVGPWEGNHTPLISGFSLNTNSGLQFKIGQCRSDLSS